jgi:hypothetical protein
LENQIENYSKTSETKNLNDTVNPVFSHLDGADAFVEDFFKSQKSNSSLEIEGPISPNLPT